MNVPKIINMGNGKYAVKQGSYYISSHTMRPYIIPRDILNYCLMPIDVAEVLCAILRESDK